MALGFAFLLLLGTPAFAQVSVSGEGAISATPDMATIVLSVVTEDTTPGAAVEANNASMAKLIKSLITLGVAKKDLHTSI